MSSSAPGLAALHAVNSALRQPPSPERDRRLREVTATNRATPEELADFTEHAIGQATGEDQPTPGPLDRDDVAVFPSSTVHGVRTMTAGIRWSLIVWAEGAPYQTSDKSPHPLERPMNSRA